MSSPVIIDTDGLLRAFGADATRPSELSDYERILTSAAAVIAPGLVPAEGDDFLRAERRAMRRLIAEILNPATRYEYELPLPAGIAPAQGLDAKFKDLGLGLVNGMVSAVAVFSLATAAILAPSGSAPFSRALDLLPRSSPAGGAFLVKVAVIVPWDALGSLSLRREPD